MGTPSFYQSQTPWGCSEQSQAQEIQQPGWRITNSVISIHWTLISSHVFLSIEQKNQMELPWHMPLLIHQK